MTDSPHAQTDKFMLAVGHGLRAWSSVEFGMSQLFMQVSGTDAERAVLIFDTIISFETRLAVLNAVMQHKLKDETDRQVWTKLGARLAKYYKKRHELAHFDVVSNLDGPIPTTEFRPFLNMGLLFAGKRNVLSVAQIEERTQKFKDIAEALTYFLARSFCVAEFSEIAPEQAPRLIQHLRTLVVQTPPAPSAPPPPSGA